MAKVGITRTTALFPNAVFLQWDITPDESGPHLIDVSRSGAPGGPWENIASQLPNAYHFLDKNFNLPSGETPTDVREGLNLFSLSREIYYQVVVTPPSGTANIFSSAPTPVEPGLDIRTRLLKRKILHDQAIGYRRLNGIPIIVLKRKRWGNRCDVCWDPVTREGTMEHCSNCYGTTYEGGYWAPVLVRGRRTPGPVQTQIDSHGNREVKNVDFWVLDYPHIEYQDIIVDLRRNDRHIVQIVTPTELKTVTVHQKLTCSLIARDAVEYSVLVDPNTTPPLY